MVANTAEFRMTILAMMAFSDWLSRYGTILRPEHFPSKDERDVVKWLNDYYATYGVEPSDVDVVEGLSDNPLWDAIVAAIPSVTDHTVDMAVTFAQTQAMICAITTSVEDIRAGDLSNVRGRIEEALRVGQDLTELGQELVRDADDWLYEETTARHYPTGWVSIDNALKGGMVGGEYGLILAPTGHGKTTALINIGYALAGLYGKANVVHVTYEMPQHKVLKRYAVRVVGHGYDRDENIKPYVNELLSRAKVSLRAKLRVVSGIDKTLSALRQLIDNLASDDFYTDALIVDYADLMHPPHKRNEYRFELSDIARGLRAVAEDYDIPVWSASQAGRQAIGKNWVDVSDIAEDIGKASIADVIIAICRSSDEIKLGQGRLFAAKLRDAKDHFPVPVKIDFARQLIAQRYDK